MPLSNEELYRRLDEAIKRGEITEEEARQIYKEEHNPYEGIESEDRGDR